MFWPARIWNTYSLPIRRAGSPVHDSSWPRIANETPAASRHVATARATRRLRSSNAAAQPTQYRTSSSSSSPAAGDFGDGRDRERQALRPVECGPTAAGPTGCPTPSMPLKAPVSSCGKRESSSTRFRRSPTILSTCSIVTGQASTHAPHVRQSHTASYGIAVSTIGRGERVRRWGCRRARTRAHHRRVRDEREAVLGLDRHVPDAHDERLGVERLAGVPGRAGLLAAPALGAGEPVEQVLPAEVRERPEAERRVLRLEVHRRQLAPRRELAEADVREARGDVEVLAERQVARGTPRRGRCAPTSRTRTAA